MKLLHLTPLVALSTAFVLPDTAMIEQITSHKPPAVDRPLKSSKTFPVYEKLPASADKIVSGIEDTYHKAVSYAEDGIDRAFSAGSALFGKAKEYTPDTWSEGFDVNGWLSSARDNVYAGFADLMEAEHPHHPPGHKHPKHPKHPHHGGHGHKFDNLTVYQLIAGSKYTTKLASLIDRYDDLVKALNSTSGTNYTVFAPTDDVFKKIPEDHPEPSKEELEAILKYHVVPGDYDARKLFVSYTLPTALEGADLGKGNAQRLRVSLGLKGLTLNFYAHVTYPNIYAKNGIVHGIDSILVPPPSALKIISIMPGEFSTLQLALEKTGLAECLAKAPHKGGVLFAPTNRAFQRLGPRVNAFLFSEHGRKHLKALIEYHVVANQTLYSDAYYPAKGEEVDAEDDHRPFHIDLPTALEGYNLSIDVARYFGFINIRINGYNDVVVHDGIAKDGVIQVPRNVLIPPRKAGGAVVDEYDGGEMDLEDFKSRFDAAVQAVELREQEQLKEQNVHVGFGWFDGDL
jgi:uncharacterized surface protein with fasciclin (FAS1) repeats